MKTVLSRDCLFLVIGLLICVSPEARGDVYIYWDFDNGFDPATVVVSPDETVYWVNYDLFGADVTVTSDDGYFSFFLQQYEGTGIIFNTSPGTYAFHSDWGDHGSVVVNVPPSVAITNPPDNTVFAAPASFTVEATASETSDDSVAYVEFFLETINPTNSIGIDYDSPYSIPVTDLAAGDHTVIAMAVDQWGWWQTNAISVTVGTIGPVTLSAPRLSEGQFLFDVSGLKVGKTNILQSSTNLASWTGLATNVADSDSMTVTNSTGLGRRYFRVLQLP
jgi:hypothetical protein